jgi:hypothetical protein
MSVGSVQSTIILPSPACTDGLNSKPNPTTVENRQNNPNTERFVDLPTQPDNPDPNAQAAPTVNSDNPLQQYQQQHRNPSPVQEVLSGQTPEQQAIRSYLDTQNTQPDGQSQLVGVDIYV